MRENLGRLRLYLDKLAHTQLGAAPDFLQHSGDRDLKEEKREGAGGLGSCGGSPFSGTPRGAASQWDLHTRGVTALLR